MLQARATIGVKRSTKERLDGHRALGQTYEGFILEMLGVWEEVVGGKKIMTKGGDNQRSLTKRKSQ